MKIKYILGETFVRSAMEVLSTNFGDGNPATVGALYTLGGVLEDTVPVVEPEKHF